MRRALLLLIAALALTAAGCGSSNDSDSSSSDAAAPAETTAAPADTTAAPAGGGADAVTIKDFAFDPKDITVKVGEKITWTNEDGAAHNVVSDSGEKIESDAIEGGKTFSFTPTKAGKITYECTFHPQMKGYSITVTS